MRKFLIIVIIVAGVGLVVYYGLNNKGAKPGSETSGISEGDEVAAGSSTILEPDKIFAEPIQYNSLKQEYSGSRYSFKYPENFKTSVNVISNTEEVVTVENSKGSGFQIFTMAWDEKSPITPERIWQDEPDAEINDPKNADLDGSQALVFYGYNGDLGETFEVWVVRSGRLYQITGPKTAEDLIIDTLETWTWKM